MQRKNIPERCVLAYLFVSFLLIILVWASKTQEAVTSIQKYRYIYGKITSVNSNASFVLTIKNEIELPIKSAFVKSVANRICDTPNPLKQLMAIGAPVRVDIVYSDKHGNFTGMVFSDNININSKIIQTGHGVLDKKALIPIYFNQFSSITTQRKS